VDSPAPAIQVELADFGAFAGGSSGGSPPQFGGPIVASPVEGGTTGTVEGGAGGGTTALGGSGGGATSLGGIGGGTTVVGSDSVTPSGSPVAGAPQVESSISLAGLGMGPLGGSGSTSGTISSAPTIQVALNAPSAGSTTSSTIALSLVTLTQVSSWSHEGQEIKPEEPPTPPDAEASTPTPPTVEASASAEAGPAGGPLEDPTAVVGVPTNVAGPALGLEIRIDPPVSAAAAGPAPSESAFTLVAAPPAIPEGVEARQPSTANWAGRWAVAAATIAAVYGSRDVIRGLQWRRGMRAAGAGWRSVEPVSLKGPHTRRSLAEAVSRPHSARVLLQRSRAVQAASPRP
jgi:hypothetical protein